MLLLINLSMPTTKSVCKPMVCQHLHFSDVPSTTQLSFSYRFLKFFFFLSYIIFSLSFLMWMEQEGPEEPSQFFVKWRGRNCPEPQTFCSSEVGITWDFGKGDHRKPSQSKGGVFIAIQRHCTVWLIVLQFPHYWLLRSSTFDALPSFTFQLGKGILLCLERERKNSPYQWRFVVP